MSKPSTIFRELQQIPGIGPSLAQDLCDLGIRTVTDLVGKSPEKLYNQLEVLRSTHIDRCVLYTFRCAVYYASNTTHDPELLKWWNWKDANMCKGKGCCGSKKCSACGCDCANCTCCSKTCQACGCKSAPCSSKESSCCTKKRCDINAEWHKEHPMPQNATTEQRMAWHKEHAKECGCRPMPEDIKQKLGK